MQSLPDTDQSSTIFVAEWNQLVSTTNWEKGRIIHEWREAMIASKADPTRYSDEAWARQVGGISGQHVGRLRRVYERFGAEREAYPRLYWSHFQAALDWDDAEMWLEGAVQNGWSVAAMRRQRWETLGAIAEDEPVDELPTDFDEDFVPPGAERQSEVRDPDERSADRNGDAADEEDYAESNEWDGGESGASAAEAAPFDMAADEPAGKAATEPFKPFQNLKELPPDLTDAFESFKLAILRHKLDEWREVSPDDVAMSLDALKQLIYAPAG